MRTLSIIPFVLLFSLLLGVSSYSTDFQKGVDAYKSGDFTTALKEWKPLAEQGDSSAQFSLGLIYDNDICLGMSTFQDYNKALRLYKLAAEQGFVKAQYNLGMMYVEGNGVIQDDIYAYMWFKIAASLGNEDAIEEREKLSSIMTPSDISEAQKLASECVKNNYKGC